VRRLQVRYIAASSIAVALAITTMVLANRSSNHARNETVLRSAPVSAATTSAGAHATQARSPGWTPVAEQSGAGQVLDAQTLDAKVAAEDRAAMFAAAALARATGNNDTRGTLRFQEIEIVDRVGHANEMSSITFDDSTALTDEERQAIVDAFAPTVVRFVPVTEPPDSLLRGNGRVKLAEPSVINGQLAIITNLQCGPMCGMGGGNVVERNASGGWIIGDQIGMMFIS
jgi:hypothetical protein